jgi:hypothetical protein
MGQCTKPSEFDSWVAAGIHDLSQRGRLVFRSTPIGNHDYLAAVACIQMSQPFESESQQEGHVHRRWE